MEERRKARVGTVSGLALLAGGTAVAAIAGGAHSYFARIALGMLAAGMGHALLDEIRRQARRGPTAGWTVQDTVNTALLGSWACGAVVTTLLYSGSVRLRVVSGGLAVGYAAICSYFVWLRRRTVTAGSATQPATVTNRQITPDRSHRPDDNHGGYGHPRRVRLHRR